VSALLGSTGAAVLVGLTLVPDVGLVEGGVLVDELLIGDGPTGRAERARTVPDARLLDVAADALVVSGPLVVGTLVVAVVRGGTVTDPLAAGAGTVGEPDSADVPCAEDRSAITSTPPPASRTISAVPAVNRSVRRAGTAVVLSGLRRSGGGPRDPTIGRHAALGRPTRGFPPHPAAGCAEPVRKLFVCPNDRRYPDHR